MLINMVLPGAVETARLPKEYQEVEYIQSSGTQYIDTRLSASSGFRFVTKVTITKSVADAQGIIGAFDNASPYRRNFLAAAENMNQWLLGAYDYLYFGSPKINTEYEIDVSTIQGAAYCKINGVQAGSYTPANASRTSKTLYLFALNTGSAASFLHGRMIPAQLYVGGVLVRDYVPCYRKADNAGGMYDLVDGVFDGNAGTGVFTVGPAVSNTPSIGDTVEFTYSGNYTDNRINGKGTVRLNTSGVMTVTGGPVTVVVTIVGAGGGGAVHSNFNWGASGGGGGNQTIEVELAPGTYEITIGTGGTAVVTQTALGAVKAGDGGNTSAFGYTSTGGEGGTVSWAEEHSTAGRGGTPNGGNGSIGNVSNADVAGGTPNGGDAFRSTATQIPNARNGGDGYVEITFI